MNFVFIILIAALCVLAMGSCHSRTREITPPEVDLCTLKLKPHEFSSKLVRVKAYIHRDPENFSIYDVRCNKDSFVWAEYDVPIDEKQRSMLRDALCQTRPCPRGEARVLVTGRLEGPSEAGYGHLNDYRFKFIITQIHEASPVTP
jgi:hypothetical protein